MIPANWYILDEALEELADATEWYEKNARGGHLLLEAVAHAIEVLANDPEISTAVLGTRRRVRRRRVDGFPYAGRGLRGACDRAREAPTWILEAASLRARS